MGKKTAASRTGPRASSTQNSGLIAKASLPKRSEGAEPGLDDRSHRTGPAVTIVTAGPVLRPPR